MRSSRSSPTTTRSRAGASRVSRFSRAPDILVAVVPVHDGGRDIHACLNALVAAGLSGERVLVVDDASRDGEARSAAERHACRYLPPPAEQLAPRGPATARNRGANAVQPSATVLLFVDADVTVHTDTVARFERLFDGEPTLTAAFGSYDDAPSDRGVISRYKNLLHHRMHQGGARAASTFWSGCGAIRRDAFLRMGGFDESFTGATIEDIELGMRLVDAGERIEVHPDIQCTHHKRWTLRSWLRTDILGRAIPWSRLLVARASPMPDTLNLGLRERATALVVCALVPTSLAPLVGVSGTAAALLFGLLLLAFGVLQRRLLLFFARNGGVTFALAAAGLHLCYYLYASASFALVRLRLV